MMGIETQDNYRINEENGAALGRALNAEYRENEIN